ncbi:response regulator [Saccharibacillus alkalitolerans]|uniref:Response regulator n=1 Tax=Saccharibacillus alkalitolerans TaxID=2705290 RepID=A0ABX0FEA3_9BACL|nr:response regulator [Saccharibacillus alkalitolerans]NGZ77352.1 response regulator [Saccharibacillus alkalitolerans]
MNKYQKLFTNQAAENLGRMLEPGARTDERTVYRMLHSIKGTSGTIGLQEWYEAALRLLEEFQEEGDRIFAGEELNHRLAELRRLLQESGGGETSAEPDGKGADAAGSVPESAAPRSLRDAVTKRGGGAVEAGTASEGTTAREREESEERRLRELEGGASEAEAAEGTVLLLDDDLGLLTLLKDELEARGFTVFATPRFDKAVEWFYEMRPDCAVLNVLMPEQSGFDLMERLRELCDRYMIPVVLMTAKTDDATRIRAYEDGADDFLTKPLNLEEFVVRIRRLIRRRRRLTGQLLLDQTTGAYGMPFLERELTRQIGLLEDPQERLAVTAVQLEGLRRLNERTGYREGDRLLRAFSDAVRRRLRPHDVWARDRASRFFLLQPGLSEAQSAAFLQDVLLKENLPELLGADEVSAVYGIAEVGAGMSRQQALAGAVRALDAAPRAEAEDSESDSAGSLSRQLRLAIIDDDSLIRTILERQLQSLEEEYELEIRGFADGEEFLSDPWHVGGSRYLLILDRMMPRMNGMEVLSRLRGGGYDPVYTVLMLTGVGDERGIAEAIRAGTDDYMTKPFSMVELEARIRRLLGKVGTGL